MSAIRRVELALAYQHLDHHFTLNESGFSVADLRAVLARAKSAGELRAEIRRMHGRDCACVHCNPRRKAGK